MLAFWYFRETDIVFIWVCSKGTSAHGKALMYFYHPQIFECDVLFLLAFTGRSNWFFAGDRDQHWAVVEHYTSGRAGCSASYVIYEPFNRFICKAKTSPGVCGSSSSSSTMRHRLIFQDASIHSLRMWIGRCSHVLRAPQFLHCFRHMRVPLTSNTAMYSLSRLGVVMLIRPVWW